MNLKKTLLIASLGGVVGSGAYAQTETWFFRWSTPSAAQAFTAFVPRFDPSPTATYLDGRTLTGVQFSIIGTPSTFRGGVEYTLPAGAAGTTEVTLSGSPGLRLGFGLGAISTFSKNISASSGDVLLPAGTTTSVNVVGSLAQPLTALPKSPLFVGVGQVTPISVRLTGSYSDETESPQGTTSVNLPITSSGIGFVRYTFVPTEIPEAETYLAGLALAGLAGWTAHRRLRR